jgi:hypothetical protein
MKRAHEQCVAVWACGILSVVSLVFDQTTTVKNRHILISHEVINALTTLLARVNGADLNDAELISNICLTLFFSSLLLVILGSSSRAQSSSYMRW